MSEVDMIHKKGWVLFSVFIAAGCFASALQLPTIFTDHMVIQRERPAPVWGTAQPGSEITVEFAGQKKAAATGDDGTWKVVLDPMEASSESRKLTVSSSIGNQKLEIDDVLVGEVWLCSGQSNMGTRMRKTTGGVRALAAADRPHLRLYETPLVASATPIAVQSALTNNPFHNAEARWKISTPKNAEYFSGVAYYFGSKLQEDLNVPVGLIWASYGGTRIESWTPASGFEGVESLSDLSRTAMNLSTLSGDSDKNKNIPTVLFNGMIYAHVPYAIRGVIWYQGESNRKDGMLYVDKTRALVNSWRALWGYEFPFYFVQIAPYENDGENPYIMPVFWEAQAEITKVIPQTGMVVISDATTLDDVHPPNKMVPGTRLALLAESDTYGMNVISSGPVFQSVKQQESQLKVVFRSSEGLTTRDGKAPDWFEIAGEDGTFKPAEAEIHEDSVLLRSPEVSHPVAVRFAWHKLAVPNLMNGAGLPAASFRASTAPSGHP